MYSETCELLLLGLGHRLVFILVLDPNPNSIDPPKPNDVITEKGKNKPTEPTAIFYKCNLKS